MAGDDTYQNIFSESEYDGQIDFKAYGTDEYDEEGEYVILPEADELYEVENKSNYNVNSDLIGKDVTVQHEGERKQGTIHGKTNFSPNMFDVSFNDGSYAEYSANILTQNLTEMMIPN